MDAWIFSCVNKTELVKDEHKVFIKIQNKIRIKRYCYLLLSVICLYCFKRETLLIRKYSTISIARIPIVFTETHLQLCIQRYMSFNLQFYLLYMNHTFGIEQCDIEIYGSQILTCLYLSNKISCSIHLDRNARKKNRAPV